MAGEEERISQAHYTHDQSSSLPIKVFLLMAACAVAHFNLKK